MFVFSKKQIPYFYFSGNWVRKLKLKTVYNETEFKEELIEIEQFKNHNLPIDNLSNPEEFILAIFIESFLARDKKTISYFEITKYYWKIHDSIYILNNKKASEAVSLELLPQSQVDDLKSDSSCLPFLFDYANFIDLNHLNYKIGDLKNAEKRELSKYRIEVRKNQISKHTIKSPTTSVSLKNRQNILFRDSSRCLLCGRTSAEIPIEVDHIIPRNIIKRLGLNSDLLTSEYNLMSFCFECNRGKSGDLSNSSIEYYINQLDYDYFKPTIEILIKLKDLPH